MALHRCTRRVLQKVQCFRSLATVTETESTNPSSTYAIESDLPVILAEPRDPRYSGRRRKNDRLREVMDGFRYDAIKTVGGNDAFLSHVLHMKINYGEEEKSYRVLPRQLRLSNNDFKPNNATFRILKPDDIVRISVPISIVGEDNCPGVKKNGFPLQIRYTLRIKCRGDHVPGALIADVSNLDFNEKLFAKDLVLPEGCTYLNVDPMECVCKISAFK